MPIVQLSPQLANQIAAGEVVERPASVIKELVENAIDANATQIDIQCDGSGVRLMRITDNGEGICEKELPLALARHATSKILTSEDLLGITSLGFRGEALASIASIAKLKLTSKPDQQKQAAAIVIKGDQAHPEITPASHPKGTTVQVEDLFYNVPARRKFLRSEKTESTHIEQTVKALALSHFSVGFSLTLNGRLVFKLPIANNPAAESQRLTRLFGKSFAQKALKVSSTRDDKSLTGWIALPEEAKRTNTHQVFFVNGRLIKDKVIAHAINTVYQPLMPPGCYPAYVLFFQLPERQVDVNVHPTKHEVRFHQARLVHDFIQSVIEHTLGQWQGHVQPVAQDFPRNLPISPHAPSRPLAIFSPTPRRSVPVVDCQPLGEVKGYRLVRWQEKLILINLHKAAEHLSKARALEAQESKPLMFPETLTLEDAQWNAFEVAQEYLLAQGWMLRQLGPSSLVITHAPGLFSQGNIGQAFLDCVSSSSKNKGSGFSAIALEAVSPERLTAFLPDWISDRIAVELTADRLAVLC